MPGSKKGRLALSCRTHLFMAQDLNLSQRSSLTAPSPNSAHLSSFSVPAGSTLTPGPPGWNMDFGDLDNCTGLTSPAPSGSCLLLSCAWKKEGTPRKSLGWERSKNGTQHHGTLLLENRIDKPGCEAPHTILQSHVWPGPTHLKDRFLPFKPSHSLQPPSEALLGCLPPSGVRRVAI